MLSFSLPPTIERLLLILALAFVLATYALMLFLKGKWQKRIVFFAVPLHLLLLCALFSVGATVDVVALVFLALLFLYMLASALLYKVRAKKGKEDEV